ncbi:hypothetical protein CDAR_21321 [Caerostris darwini]|uniref:Uncharacterized protein n=1 Tax=Caerostris darwini TaxID=1538125 RepID=A0AAV4VZM9_9ARAC|nr:hypothetical protein CDAR_21321 [Caerostris darwini]
MTCSEVVYGTTLRLSSNILCSDQLSLSSPTQTYIPWLRTILLSLHPTATSKHCTESIYTHPSLYSCSHAYLRIVYSRPYYSRTPVLIL